MTTNTERAWAASDAIDTFRVKAHLRGEHVDDVIVDLLTATMHLIDRFDTPDPNARFEALAERARQVYIQQIESAPDQCLRDLGSHHCIRAAEHGGHHACTDDCHEGHLRLSQVTDGQAVSEFDRKHRRTIYLKYPVTLAQLADALSDASAP